MGVKQQLHRGVKMEPKLQLLLGTDLAVCLVIVALAGPAMLEEIRELHLKLRRARMRRKMRRVVRQVKRELLAVQQSMETLQAKPVEMPVPPWPLEPRLRLIHPRTTSLRG